MGPARGASHNFGPAHAEVTWRSGVAPVTLRPRSLGTDAGEVLRVMHITDNHISLHDDDAPRTTRMFNAFSDTEDASSGAPTTPQDEFVRLLREARNMQVDLIALGGDVVNFPSRETVAWVVEQLRHTGLPYIFTAGNHDWHTEGIPGEARYDARRIPELNSTLFPLFEHSLPAAGGGTLLGRGGILGSMVTVKGVDFILIDNSNHQVNEEQLAFARSQLAGQEDSGRPAVLMMHMPLSLPGLVLPPKYTSGHPDWGADTDELWEIEGRPRWPAEGNLPSTRAFMQLVEAHSAPAGRMVAILTGHVHKDFSTDFPSHLTPALLTSLACGAGRQGCQMRGGGNATLDYATAEGALQYTTFFAAEGGYRLLSVRRTDGRGQSTVQSKSRSL